MEVSQIEMIEYYQSAVQNTKLYKIDADKKATIFSWSRLIILAVSLGLIYWMSSISMLAVAATSLLSMMSFIYAVVQQQKFEKYSTELARRILVDENEISVISEKKNLYYNGESYRDENHYFAIDLDAVGDFSLFHLLNRSKSFTGNQFLKEWLFDFPKKDEILRRQEAVKEVSTKPEFMNIFQANMLALEGQEYVDVSASIHKILDNDFDSMFSTFVKKSIQFVPFISVFAFVILFIDVNIGMQALTIIFIINFLLTGKYSHQTSKIQLDLSQVFSSIVPYQKALETLRTETWSSSLIVDNKSNDIKALSTFRKIMNRLDYRLNLIATIILNGFFLWDLRIMMQLANWKVMHEQEIDIIFEWIGFMEGLTGLARFAINSNRHFNYPKLIDGEFTLQGEDMIHPLMDYNSAVSNTFSLGSDKRLAIITGSNMAGKSTLLRTIGVNMLLGYMGTVCAAKNASIPIVQLITYMRIKDNLEEHVSTFKAELNRIEMILGKIESGIPIFILIDEMLRGTNSRDKLNGSIAFTEKLIVSKTPSIIATHDIQLASLESKYPDKVDNYYFDIEIANNQLTFDYKLKNGICRTFNASFLLKQLGLNTDVNFAIE